MVRFQIGPHNSVWQNKAYTNRAEEFVPDARNCLASDCAVWVPCEFDPDNQGHCGLINKG